MPVEFRNIEPPTTWQIFPRHPAGADYPDLSKALAKRMRDGIEQYGVMMRPVVLKREQNGMYVLDGWQMYQQCVAAGVKPEFVELVGGIDPAKFAEIKNDVRRHESLAEYKGRIAERKKLAREKSANGTPARQVAKELGVGKSTVLRDLKPDPPKIIVRCDRCARINASGDDCANCLLLRMDLKDPRTDPPNLELPKESYDANFVIVPEHALGAFQTAGELAHLCHELDRIVKHLSKLMADKVGTRAVSQTLPQRLADCRTHLWQARATHVCAYCQGQPKDDCTACRGQGWQSAAAFAQAPTEFQDAMRKMGARNVPI